MGKRAVTADVYVEDSAVEASYTKSCSERVVSLQLKKTTSLAGSDLVCTKRYQPGLGPNGIY